MRRCLLAVVLAAFLLSAGAPASAGGGWWDYLRIDDTDLAVGESASADTRAYWFTLEDADWDTPYYAYLVRGFDRELLQDSMGAVEPDRWWALRPDAELIRLGEVNLKRFGIDGTARTRFEVPAVAPGRWDLMLCDAGCVRPLGNVIPTEVQIVSEPAPPPPPAPVWPWAAGSALAFAAAMLLVVARRRPHAPEGPADEPPADDSGGGWERPAPLVGAGRARDR